MSENLSTRLILSGFGNNLLYVLLACIIPIAAGIGLTFAMRAIKGNGVRLTLRIAGVLFYCLVPVVLMTVLYFSVLRFGRSNIPPIVIALTVSHIGYFAIKYDVNATAKKNITLNTLGVLSSLFMWSTTVGFVGAPDILRSCQRISAASYSFIYYFIALLICFSVLAALNIPRMILKEKMK